MLVKRLRHALGALHRDRSGLALLEFALVLPIVAPIGLYAIELSNFGITQLKLSQATLTLADNASRAGVDTNLATQELREVDVNDVFQGLRLESGSLDLAKNGRITLSSLEPTTANIGGQWIHWQRCLGLKRGAGYDSTYGSQGAGGSFFSFFFGMGEPGEKVIAPPNSAVMFVEINYDYTPLITNYFIGNTKLHQIASFIVRDNRDFDKGVTNPSPAATSMTCNKYTT